MKSMTGHGRGTGEAGGRRVTVEIRSVNHRFLDLKLRSGPLDPRLEEKVNAQVRAQLERGAVTVAIREEGTSVPALRVDVAAARRAVEAIDEVRRAIGSVEPVPLSLIL